MLAKESLYPKEMILKVIQGIQITATAKQNAQKILHHKESWELCQHLTQQSIMRTDLESAIPC